LFPRNTPEGLAIKIKRASARKGKGIPYFERETMEWEWYPCEANLLTNGTKRLHPGVEEKQGSWERKSSEMG